MARRHLRHKSCRQAVFGGGGRMAGVNVWAAARMGKLATAAKAYGVTHTHARAAGRRKDGRRGHLAASNSVTSDMRISDKTAYHLSGRPSGGEPGG